MPWILSQDKSILVDAQAITVTDREPYQLYTFVNSQAEFIVGKFNTKEQAMQELQNIADWITTGQKGNVYAIKPESEAI